MPKHNDISWLRSLIRQHLFAGLRIRAVVHSANDQCPCADGLGPYNQEVRLFSQSRQRLTRLLLPFIVVCASLGSLFSAAASATTDTFYSGAGFTIHVNYPWLVGPAHTLTNVGADVSGSTCVGAINVNGGELAGAGYCGGAGWVNHPYCGCELRDGAIYPYGSGWGAAFTANESY